MERFLIGLSIGSGLEGVDAVALRATGVGLDLSVTSPTTSIRVLFPPGVRDMTLMPTPSALSLSHPGLTRNIAESAVHAVRQLLTRVGVSARDTFAVGFMEPSRYRGECAICWPEVADRVAEQTGLTVVHGFRHRDRAAGGSGFPITPVADYLLFRQPHAARLLIHFGAATNILFVPASAKVTAVLGFEAGPGNQLLDALVYHGSRGKEATDYGGKKAVQGRCLEPLLQRWLEHPHLTRTPPKSVHPEAFGRSFLLAAFESARQLGAGLPDLLCTATHLVARVAGNAVRAWLPPATPRQILATGGGVRNGFLWQLVSQQFEGETISRADEAGMPPLARNAAAAAVLVALTCDGVAGSLPVLSGASGGRLLGHFALGDGRNWAKVISWIAEQTRDYPQMGRVA